MESIEMTDEEVNAAWDRRMAQRNEKQILIDDVESKMFKLMESLKLATEAGLEVEIKNNRFRSVFSPENSVCFNYEINFKGVLRNSTGQ